MTMFKSASLLATARKGKLLLAALSLSLPLATAACGTGLGGEGGDGELPPLEALFIPTPEQSQSGGGQALCQSGTSAIDEANAIIDAENAALAGDRALIEAALAASPVVDESGIAIYEADVDGRTLTLEVATDGQGQYAYTGTLVDDDGEHDYLAGAMAAGGAQGSLTVTPPGEDELAVAWSETGSTLAFARTLGDTSTAFDQSESDIKVVSGDTIVWWSLDDYAGIVIGDGLPVCFEGGETSGDFCDAECDADALAQLGGDVGDLTGF